MKNWIKAVFASIFSIGVKFVACIAIFIAVVWLVGYIPSVLIQIGELLVGVAFFGLCGFCAISVFIDGIKERKERYDRDDERRKYNGYRQI